jgi:hypothetical protein
MDFCRSAQPAEGRDFGPWDWSIAAVSADRQNPGWPGATQNARSFPPVTYSKTPYRHAPMCYVLSRLAWS